ncbi:MAG: hypothetical protein IPM52_00045 [Bacteroidetes bacterium]|nr:hypothetical protein [Bacteroidota bacterium]
MRKHIIFLIAIGLYHSLLSQTTVFEDNFSTHTSDSWTTSGAIGSSAWSVNRSGADLGSRRQVSGQILELTNDASATANANGWVFAYVNTANFTSPYNTTFASNSGIITWWFNMRQIRTDPSGFSTGNYGVALVLGSTADNPSTSGSGYAVVLGQSGSTDPVRLASFDNGLAGTLTNLITSNTTGLTDFGNDYLSIKVTYNPANHQWELFVRNDGSSAFADPQTGTLTSQGTVTNSAYTSTSMAYFGAFWNAATSASQTAFFDNVAVQLSGGASPVIAVSPTSLSNFNYTVGGGPSAAQSFTVSGNNLTGNISLSAPVHYEISLSESNSYSKSLVLTPVSGTVASTTVYVRLESGLEAGSYNNEQVVASSPGAANASITLNGAVNQVVNEPSEHPATFVATTNTTTSVTLAWSDANPPADAYLIKGSASSFADITNPTDGIPEANASLRHNVSAGIQSHQFTGLTPGTTHYFKLFPYNGSGASINYKTDGSIPQTTSSTLSPAQTTYTWSGPTNGSWNTASHWTPARNSAQASDILQFNDGGTYTITGLSNQTVAKITVSNNTKITLQAASANQTLTIAGDTGADLALDSGTELNISGSNALTINLLTGTTASIQGKMTFAGGGHRFTGADAGSITFENGSQFTAGTGFTGSAFGTTNLNSVVFASGSVYEQLAGSNPFGAAAPNAVVVFQTGSLYRLKVNQAPAFSNRTYADFEFDHNGSVSPSGGNPVSINNLTIKQGTFNFNMTGNPGHSIKGNIQILPTATLSFAPTSAGIVNLNGTQQQTITGGGTLNSGTNSSINMTNLAGVVLDNDATLAGNLQVQAGATFTLNPGKRLTVTGTLTNNGTLTLKSNASGTASLIHNTNNVPATIERYITGNTVLTGTYDYHLVSVPLNAGVTAAQFLGSYLYEFNTSTQSWAGLGSSTSAPLPNDRGYMIFYPNTSTTYTFTGQLNNGSFTAATPLTAADQFALVPNPYPSAIDWDTPSGWTKTNLQNAIWIWNPVLDQYASYIGGVGANGGTQYIPVGQAFFVKSNAASPVLGMNNDVRVHNNSPFFKNSGQLPNLLRIHAQGNNRQDEIVLHLRQGSLTTKDEFDGDKLYGAPIAPQLYFILPDGRELAINNIPPDAPPISLPVGFKLQAEAQVNLSFEGLETFGNELHFVLEDLLTGSLVNLRENPTYAFVHNPANNAQRFVLHLTSITATPDAPALAQARFWMHGNDICIALPDVQQPVNFELFDALGRHLGSYRRDAAPLIRIPAPKAAAVIIRATTGNKVYSSKVFTR